MFSTLDYFSKRLTFQNINSLSTLQLGSIFYPEVQEFPLLKRVCTSQLLINVNEILLGSSELNPNNLNQMIDNWLIDTATWRQVGISSIFYDCVINFMNKKSILIDDSVFLISNSDSDTEEVLQMMNSCKKESQNQESYSKICIEGNMNKFRFYNS
jgi:hypothetical protein